VALQLQPQGCSKKRFSRVPASLFPCSAGLQTGRVAVGLSLVLPGVKEPASGISHIYPGRYLSL